MRVPSFGEISRRFRVNKRSFQYVSRLYLQGRQQQTRWVHHRTEEGLWQGLTDDTDGQVQSDDEFLRRASQYGIQSLQELDRQSRYFNQKDPSQLIQKRRFRSDIHLWQLLLDYQSYYHGSDGVKSIYDLLKYQGPVVRLSSENNVVSALWKQMLVIAARDSTSFDLFGLLCERNGIAWARPKLFVEAITILLESNKIDKALLMCDKLLEKRSSEVNAALDIILAFRSGNIDGLARFLTVYQQLGSPKIYEKAMESLWQSDRNEEAVLFHKLLISQGDVPSSFHYIGVLMQHLAKTDTDPTTTIKQLLAAGIDYGHRARRVYEASRQRGVANEQENLLRVSDQAHTTSNRMSESIAAKAFATSALPFEFVLNSLKAFGLTEIGPQTIREIGLVAKDLDTMRSRLDILQERGIDTGASAYVRTVRTLCKKGDATLLTKVLETDIHHDVFEDAHLQLHLVSDHLKKCDWNKVNLLLTSACHGSIRGHLADAAKTAVLIKPNRRDNRHRAFLNFAMQIDGSYRVSEMPTLRNRVKSMIFEMRLQKIRDQFTPYQQLLWAKFMAGVMQEAVLGGQCFEVFEWRHVISRIGGRGMPDLAIGLVYWIARMQHGATSNIDRLKPISSLGYAGHLSRVNERLARHGALDSSVKVADSDPLPVTARLIDRRFQQSLMHWSLQQSLHEKARKPRETWQNCLKMLRLLEQKYAIPIDLKALRQVIVMRCRYLRPQRSRLNVRSSIDHNHRSADGSTFERNREMNRAAWRACSQVISELDNLWSVSPEERNANLDKAFESLFAKKRRVTWPYQTRKVTGNIDDTNYDYL